MAARPGNDGVRYVALDAMRGVAALLVVILHSSRMLQGQWAPGGYLAVDLFFALSGFVIAHNYDSRFDAGLSPRRFLLMRVIRFWPLYVLGLALGIVHQLLLIATHNDHAPAIAVLMLVSVLGLAFIPAPVRPDGNLFPFNPPSWSLFMELIANAAYAFAFPILTARILAGVAMAAALLFAMFGFLHGSADIGATVPTFAGGLARMVFSFCAGVLIYRTRWRPFALPLPLLLAMVAGLLLCPVPSGWRGAYDIMFVLFLSPLLVAVGATSRTPPRLMTLSEKLGLASYPVYAIHRPLVELVTPVVERLHVPPVLAGLLFVGGLVVLGLLLDLLFDRKARKILSDLAGVKRERPLSEASLP